MRAEALASVLPPGPIPKAEALKLIKQAAHVPDYDLALNEGLLAGLIVNGLVVYRDSETVERVADVQYVKPPPPPPKLVPHDRSFRNPAADGLEASVRAIVLKVLAEQGLTPKTSAPAPVTNESEPTT